MSWQEEYKSKLCSYEQAAKIVKSGDRFFTPLGLGEPSTAMIDAVADRKDELEDVQYISALVFHFTRFSRSSTENRSICSVAFTMY